MRSKWTGSTRTTQDQAAARTDLIETARLVGEPVSGAHHDDLGRLLGDPRVGRTLGGTKTPEEVANWIAAEELQRTTHGFGQWVWRLRSNDEFVARGGLRRTELDGALETEVAWAVMPAHWSRGYATEIAQASVAHAFSELALGDVVAFTLPGNDASRRVMEKAEFQYEKEILHTGLPHVLYRRRREARG